MDDISREPVPGPSLRRAPRGKGPSELLELEAACVDEEALDRRGQESGEASASRVADGHLPVSDRKVIEIEADRMQAEDPKSQEDAGGEQLHPLEESLPGADVPELSDADELAKVMMAILLTSRDSLGTMRLAEVCNSTQKAVQAGLEKLAALLSDQGLPLELHKTGDRYSLLTIPAVHPFLQRMRSLKKADKLSPAALETLAVVAYRQPVIRAEVESIRGVKAGPTLRSLLDHKLISVVGRADVPGRPLQYGTSQLFLERFGLSSLKDLPSIQEFRSLG